MNTPFNRAGTHGRELEYIQDAISRGKLAGSGHYTSKSNNMMRMYTGAKESFLTHSCTAALEMAAILLDLEAGDEVILPSFTFPSTANAVVLRGATPVFCDICRKTLNIDPEKIEEAITPHTKAIFVVHYAGIICDMERIEEIARKYDLVIVEDAAQALMSKRAGRSAGSFGAMAAFSFHETKNIISGEGGALTINDPRYIERAEIIMEKGTNRKLFFRGEVNKYIWVDLGSSYCPSELVASFLYAQLELAQYLTDLRLEAWSRYHEALEDAEKRKLITRPYFPLEKKAYNGHMYQILLPNPDFRELFIQNMKKRGITTLFHYVPLHSSPAGIRYGRSSGNMEVTNNISVRLVRLPMFAGVEAEQDQIIMSILETLDVIFFDNQISNDK